MKPCTVLLPLLLLAAPFVSGQTTTDDVRGETIVHRGDRVSVFRGDMSVPAGVRLDGSLTCVGGRVTIDGEVDGDVFVILGEAVVRGEVGGEVVAVGSGLELDGATVDRDVTSVMGSLILRDSRLERSLIKILGRYERDALTEIAGEVTNVGGIGGWSPDLWALLFWLRLSFKIGIFLIMLLIVALGSDRVRRIADDAPVRYVSAFLTGILGYVGFWVLSGLLVVSVFGAALLPLVWIAFVVLKWLGIAGIFFALGRRVSRGLFGREMSMLAAVLSIFFVWCVISLAPSALGLGGLLVAGALRTAFFLAVEAPAVGLVILTFAGSRIADQTPLEPPARDDSGEAAR